MSRQLSLEQYELFHETLYEIHQPDRNMIRCFGCRELCWEDEAQGGFCTKCQIINEKEVTA